MKVIWSNFASKTLRDIYDYYKEIAGEKTAKKIKDNILKSTKQLLLYPKSGQIEETLKYLEEGHRYLVKNKYKVIYKNVEEGILITDVFDLRQDPIKLNNPKRNAENY